MMTATKPRSRKAKEIPFEDLFRHRYAFRNHLQRRENGCLFYIRKPGGKPSNPPLIGLGGGKTTQFLRTWIWEQHNGHLARGTFIHMSCENKLCFQYAHMSLENNRPAYELKNRDYLAGFSKTTIRTILYFTDKVPKSIIEKIVGLEYHAIGRISAECQNCNIEIHDHWQPKPSIIRKVEMECLPAKTIYLGPYHLSEAKFNISSSAMEPRKKDILIWKLMGERNSGLMEKYALSHLGVTYVYRRALVDIYKDIGYRPWMMLASKGVITK